MMPSAPRRLALALGLAAVLVACGGSGDDADGPAVPSGAVEASLVSLDVLPEEIAAAIADAAVRFGVSEQEVAIAGALRVVWSDGALGCPEDGVMYTQALVDGYLLTVEVAGRRVAYHGEDGEFPFLCER
jgi:hypothetical protein